MTSDEFRKMALEIPTAVERSHMNHPDFRVAGKIFASLGVLGRKLGHGKAHARAAAYIDRKGARGFQAFQRCLGSARLHECLSSRREGDHCAHCACADAAAKNVANKSLENAERPTSNIQPPMIPINAVDSRHGGVLEKCVLECWLKRAGFSFANSKLRSDFELSGAMNFHVHPAALCQ